MDPITSLDVVEKTENPLASARIRIPDSVFPILIVVLQFCGKLACIRPRVFTAVKIW
jgi:hypothetical protein